MTAVFITIPLSHYCEKARWGLDRLALPYREQPHAPLLNRLSLHGGTVPMLVHDGTRLVDSTEILVYADKLCGGDLLYPLDATLRAEVDSLEEGFDSELGPHTRRWAYSHLLPNPELLRSAWSNGVPRREAWLVPLIAPLARYLARVSYKVTPDSALRSLERIRRVFQDVDARLHDGRRYLVRERFTAADLTFAALAAPALFPPECRAAHPEFAALPPAMREEIVRMRQTAAGKFALRLYSEERVMAAHAQG